MDFFRPALIIPVMACLLLPACANGGANHVGNPLTLPGRAVLNGIENGSYNSRRAKVSKYVNTNIAAIYGDIDSAGGIYLTNAMDIAIIPQTRRRDLISELAAHPDIYRQKDIEPLIVAIMVYGP